jgi:hypothetical protein
MGASPVTLSVGELRAVAARHLRNARKCSGQEREFELYLARAYKFLADDQERLRSNDERAEPP